MNYKDYIKDEYCDIYVRERDNLADRIIEAKYNLLFLTMAHKRSEIFNSTHYVTERFEIGVILRRIYITVAWELALQIKAFTEDNDKDTLTVNKLKNHIFKYLKDEKKQEVFDEIGSITKIDDWNTASETVSRISDYRNQIVGHNIFNSPKLTFDIEEAQFVILQYEKLFKVLSFHDSAYIKRVKNTDDEMTDYIKIFLDALLPLA